MSKYQSIELIRGNDRTLPITVRDDAGVVINLTGMTAQFRIARSEHESSALVQKSLGSGITIIDAPNGRLDITLTDADTNALPLGTIYHELRLTDSGNRDVTVMHGDVSVRESFFAT